VVVGSYRSLSVTGVFDAPDNYQFPLASFTLNTVNSDGSPGPVVATSPKTDYCITGDTFVGGVPNTPNQTFIPATNCDDPTKPLGWSVGWGDQYDQTDSGQPIDLTGVPDGTYVLHATVDPQHVLTESTIPAGLRLTNR
jgi:lysyl oxidase